jgi:hypothetical protein
MNFRIFKETVTPVPEREPEVFLRLVQGVGDDRGSVRLLATDEGGRLFPNGEILEITHAGYLKRSHSISARVGLRLDASGRIISHT